MTDRMFMLDTDTVSFALRGEGDIGTRLTALAPSEICISAITLSELRFGAEKRKSKRLHGLIDTFTATIDVLPFEANSAAVFGKISASLRARGAPIGILDTLIAAHAMSLGLTLVSNHAKHFRRVRGLSTQNWFRR